MLFTMLFCMLGLVRRIESLIKNFFRPSRFRRPSPHFSSPVHVTDVCIVRNVPRSQTLVCRPRYMKAGDENLTLFADIFFQRADRLEGHSFFWHLVKHEEGVVCAPQ